MSLSIKDIQELPQIVIVESDSGIQLFEFEGRNAFERANNLVLSYVGTNFSGRIISAVRYRQTGDLDYAAKHNTGICR